MSEVSRARTVERKNCGQRVRLLSGQGYRALVRSMKGAVRGLWAVPLGVCQTASTGAIFPIPTGAAVQCPLSVIVYTAAGPDPLNL